MSKNNQETTSGKTPMGVGIDLPTLTDYTLQIIEINTELQRTDFSKKKMKTQEENGKFSEEFRNVHKDLR